MSPKNLKTDRHRLSKNLVQLSWYGNEGPIFKDPGFTTYVKSWNNAWKKWKEPFNTANYKYPLRSLGSYIDQTYWLLSVVERAASADPEKIIKVWEGDTYQYANGKIQHMRACDHKTVQDLHVFEYVPPAEQKELFNIPPIILTRTLADSVADLLFRRLRLCRG